PIVEHYLGQFTKKYNKPGLAMSEAAMRVLSSYDWPGNVRELKNVIERSIVLSRGSVIEPEDFPEKLRQQQSPFSDTRMSEEQIMTLEEMERMYVRKVLEYTGGNKLQAARLLNIDPKTLRTKLADSESHN
ncbi:MAG TPA: helix-turn-helix domain-containing protein, partial [Candidatus Ozemobacteraceae bacterium]|nr:helix-turn-helix domain-containing protein [Candidatus Ozemobacteraceae bacterium]